MRRVPIMDSPVPLDEILKQMKLDRFEFKSTFSGLVLTQPCPSCQTEIPLILSDTDDDFREYEDSGLVFRAVVCPNCRYFLTKFDNRYAKKVYDYGDGQYKPQPKPVETQSARQIEILPRPPADSQEEIKDPFIAETFESTLTDEQKAELDLYAKEIKQRAKEAIENLEKLFPQIILLLKNPSQEKSDEVTRLLVQVESEYWTLCVSLDRNDYYQNSQLNYYDGRYFTILEIARSIYGP